MTRSVYIAGPLGEAWLAQLVAAGLRARGYTITSRWHDIAADGASDPPNATVRAIVLDDNIADIVRAHAVVALTHVGEPRATYGEIAYALARRARVVWLQGPGGEGRCIWDAHAGVRRLVVRGAVDCDLVMRELEAT